MENADRGRYLLIGALLGAGIGALGGYLLLRRSRSSGRPVKLTPRDGVRIGTNVLATLQSVVELAGKALR